MHKKKNVYTDLPQVKAMPVTKHGLLWVHLGESLRLLPQARGI
jgi:hypothetical protein